MKTQEKQTKFPFTVIAIEYVTSSDRKRACACFHTCSVRDTELDC
jgi:hypothetical protein